MGLDARTLPARPGAYLMTICLEQRLDLDARGIGATTLAPGTYVYCGSARGPGGIRARIAHHLRAEKRAHWHIDRLTAAGRVTAVAAAPEGSECALFAAVSGLRGASVPAPGFGSSDCRSCAAHLVRIDDEILAGADLGPTLHWLKS